MRVAFSGAHRVGKTTLVAAIAELAPGHEVFDEPYRVLEDAGHDFADPPSIADYEAQLLASIELVAAAPADALFDRCPLDPIAYLQALADDEGDDLDLDGWLDDARAAIARLELIVVVPIEAPDRIAVAAHEDRRLRRRVDERVRRLALDDPFALVEAVEIVEVTGPLADRVAQVARAMRLRRPG